MAEDTRIFRAQQHRDRWSGFGGDGGLLGISEGPPLTDLRAIDIFREYDDAFLNQLGPDVSIATWAPQSVLFEQGSYLDVAFYVLEGEVAVYLSGGADAEAPARLPIFDRVPTADLSSAPDASPPTVYQRQSDRAEGGAGPVLLTTMDIDLVSTDSVVRLGVGEFFGEIGALSGWPQSVTARTTTQCRLVQIRMPALRSMRRKSSALKKRLDARYRERSLRAHLMACPLLQHCPPARLEDLAEHAELISCAPDEVLLEQDAGVDALYLVRSGFLKLSRRAGDRQQAVSYISKGMTAGEVELLIEGLEASRFTITSVGHSEIVKIPAALIASVRRDLPPFEAKLWEAAVDRIRETGAALADSRRAEFVDIALREGLVEGNSILVIDLDDCTRCDDCVRACAETHGGRPRFVREGERLGRLLVAKSCYHCQDPLCLVGCPTGAIRRANVGAVVEIREPICIGCGTCAANCPYDAIVMHETGMTWPANAVPERLRGTDRFVASKCDLCYTSSDGPACVRSCPQGCATRISSVAEFERMRG